RPHPARSALSRCTGRSPFLSMIAATETSFGRSRGGSKLLTHGAAVVAARMPISRKGAGKIARRFALLRQHVFDCGSVFTMRRRENGASRRSRMKAFLWITLIALVLLAVFTIANWSLFTAPATL